MCKINSIFLVSAMILFACLFLCVGKINALSISNKEAHLIAEKIWKNECVGTVKGLTSWNQGENFASLGIGHFIWYPPSKKERFQETFPSLLAFLKENHVTLPTWLTQIEACPWSTREQFYKEFDEPKMIELRQLLFETRDLQAVFIVQRLEKTLPAILEHLPAEERSEVKITFFRLASLPQGLYALIDYLNFKGAGISSSEVYHQQGWGLTQVLQRVNPEAKDIIADFIRAAKEVLEQRVRNAPPERHEERWLKGWFNRLDTYSKRHSRFKAFQENRDIFGWLYPSLTKPIFPFI